MLSNNQKVVGHVPPDPTYDEIPAEVMNKHLESMGFEARSGRAKQAVELVED